MVNLHLQLALDSCPLADACDMAARAAPLVDTMEVGTPLLMRAGVAALPQIAQYLVGHACALFADTKISDEGGTIARLCFEAGADVVSVVDGASRETLREVRAVADEFGKQVWVDLLNHTNPIVRARALSPYANGFILHRPPAGRLPTLLIEGLLAIDRPIRLAGGMTLEEARRAIEIQQTVGERRVALPSMEGIIVGRAVTEAQSFEAALTAFFEICHPARAAGDPRRAS